MKLEDENRRSGLAKQTEALQALADDNTAYMNPIPFRLVVLYVGSLFFMPSGRRRFRNWTLIVM